MGRQGQERICSRKGELEGSRATARRELSQSPGQVYFTSLSPKSSQVVRSRQRRGKALLVPKIPKSRMIWVSTPLPPASRSPRAARPCRPQVLCRSRTAGVAASARWAFSVFDQLLSEACRTALGTGNLHVAEGRELGKLRK